MYCRVDHQERRESPWIARRSERVCSTDVPLCGDRLDLEKCAEYAGWCCKKNEERRTPPCHSKQVCCKRRGEECGGLDFVLLVSCKLGADLFEASSLF